MTNATADFSTGGPFQYIRKITVLQWGQCLHFRLNGGIGIRFFYLEPTILDVIISGIGLSLSFFKGHFTFSTENMNFLGGPDDGSATGANILAGT